MGAWLKPSNIECELDWRIYDPIADGEIFVGSTWRESVLAPFAKLVSDKKYSKIDYETWRNLKKEYDYWVIYFAVSVKEPYYPTDVIIEAYNKDTFTEKHFIKQYRLVYPLNFDEDNFGEYLVTTYFNSNFYFHKDIMDNPVQYDKSLNSGSKDENETYKCNPTVGARILCYQLFPQERKKKNMDTTASTTVTNSNYISTASTNIDWSKLSNDWTISAVHPIDYGSVSIATDNFAKQEQVDKIDDRLNVLEKTLKEQANTRKENKKMKMFNFDFGPIKDNDAVRMSPYGIAVKNVNGTYQAYDKKNGEIMDVDIFNFKADNMFFKIPVAIDAIEAGDVIIFNRRPCFVFGFSEQGDVIAIDIAMGEKKTILPSKSPFGFNYITKIVSLVDNMFGGEAPSAENPFGNILPFMLMNEDNSSMKDMLPMMMLMNGNAGGTIDPMMLYFMMKADKGDTDSMLPFLLMTNKK